MVNLASAGAYWVCIEMHGPHIPLCWAPSCCLSWAAVNSRAQMALRALHPETDGKAEGWEAGGCVAFYLVLGKKTPSIAFPVVLINHVCVSAEHGNCRVRVVKGEWLVSHMFWTSFPCRCFQWNSTVQRGLASSRNSGMGRCGAVAVLHWIYMAAS